jgi:hypothetical protein
LPASQFIVKGGSVYTGRNGVSRAVLAQRMMWLPRSSASYQLNNKTYTRRDTGFTTTL